MDPVSILSIAGAAGSLAFKCGTIVQTLHCLRERFKQAELTILSVIQDCRTIELAWSQIEKWAANNTDDDGEHDELAERLQDSIYSGKLFMAELEKDLASLERTPKYSALRRRTKIVWNESMLRVHQDRIQRQICALTLLLEIIQLPLKSDRAELLSIKEPVFRSVRESVRSIVPTNLSICSDDASSIMSLETSEISYVPFAFEDLLFTSYVYKRNFRTHQMQFKQVQRKPKVVHTYGRIERSIGQTDNVSRDVKTSQELDFSPDSAACKISLDFDTTVCTDHSRKLMTSTGSAKGLHVHSSGIICAPNHDQSEHQSPVSVKSTVTVDTRLPITEIHDKNHVDNPHTATDVAIHQDMDIKCEPFSSAEEWREHLEPIGNTSDSMLTQVLLKHLQTGHEPESSSIEQAINLISQFRKEDLEAERKWAQIETVLLEYMLTRLLLNDDIARLQWTGTMPEDQSIANAASYGEIAKATDLLHLTPTALQLACATSNSIVVEYLLSSGWPLIPLDWRVHPFILATKRRCKIILELFLRLAKNAVSRLIKNFALAMVVNQDCALSESALYLDHNDNKRIGEDVNIVSFLLANGSSPNCKDKSGISVLSMAIQAAYSLNPFSLQIVDILLRAGAKFGSQEQTFMKQGPLEAFVMLMQRHKLTFSTRQMVRKSLPSSGTMERTPILEVGFEAAQDEPHLHSSMVYPVQDWRSLRLPFGVRVGVPEPSYLTETRELSIDWS